MPAWTHLQLWQRQTVLDLGVGRGGGLVFVWESANTIFITLM
jgi:cyclopropane fatty-acyl-phospholipid synthase-like methyltransferase